MTETDLATLFMKHRQRVVQRAHNAFGYFDLETVDSIYSGLWEKLVEALPRTQAGPRFESYLLSSLLNKLRDERRDRIRGDDVMSVNQWVSITDPDVVEQIETLSATEQLREAYTNVPHSDWYARLLDTLPGTQRVAFELYHIYDCTLSEVAEHLGIPLSKANRLVRRAVLSLKANYGRIIDACHVETSC